MICQICNKELKNKKALTSHNWRSHTKEGLEHIKKINKPYKEGRKAWNLGLTKETNSIIKKSAELYSNKVKLGELIPYWKNKKHSIESKIKIGKKLSKNNKGGRCKWFEVCNNF
jgi:hypothetical protein